MEMVVQYIFFKRPWYTIPIEKSKTHPKDDFRACDDFFVLVVKSHILAAAMKVLNIESLNEIPKGKDCDWMLPDEERKSKLEKFCNAIIQRFIKVGLLEDNIPDTVGHEMELDDESEADDHETESDTDSENESEQKSVADDGVLEYAKDLMSLGMLYLEYCDAVSNGDGVRAMCC